MGANKFATMLHRNKTPRIAIILIYTLLEWVLIGLLLMNGLFSYLIACFADFFGLKPPCVLCSRVDHIFGRRKSYEELLCESHAVEVSKLGYCSSHGRLGEAAEMCEDCSAARPETADRTVAVLSWMKRIEEGEKDLRCSCCDVILESGFFSPFLVLKPQSFGVLDCAQQGKLDDDRSVDDDDDDDDDDVGGVEEHGEREFVVEDCDACVKEVVDDESCELITSMRAESGSLGEGDRWVPVECVKEVVDDESCELITSMRAESGLLGEGERWVPVALIDSSTLIVNKLNSAPYDAGDEQQEEDRDHNGYNLVEKVDAVVDVGIVLDSSEEDEEKVALLSTEEISQSQNLPPVDVGIVSDSEEEEEEEKVALLSIREISQSQNLPLVDLGIVWDSEEEEEEEKVALLSIREISQSQNLPLVDVGIVSDSEEEEVVALLSTRDISQSQNLPLVDVEKECSFADHQCGASPLVSTLEQELDVQVEAEHAEGFGEFQASEEDSKAMNAASEEDSKAMNAASEEDSKAMDADANCEISIGSEICDHEQIELPPFDEVAIPHSACTDEQCAANFDVIIDKEQASSYFNHIEAGMLEESMSRSVNGLSIRTDVNEVEDERMFETPTSIDSPHALHRRFLLMDRRESGTESWDGSVASEIDGNEMLTVDHLKTALKTERKALSALYAELEEERSASAVAANQTMAMITRLQEEKAAMQMEALQYQRMMEEQSEYDQEALQLLNELMMKREKEKHELEKELEVYRKKVLIYEAKERRKAAERSKTNGNVSGTSCASSSADDSDDLSFESHEGDYCNYGHNDINHNTPPDDVLSSGADQETNKHLISLDESLADFEEERLSILDQLKALEEKLFSVDEDELNSMGQQHFSHDNGHGLNGNFVFHGNNDGGLVNGFEDDFDANGKLHNKPRNVLNRGKRLLPLFDATIGMEGEDELSSDHEMRNGSPRSVSRCAIDDHQKLAIAEEVDNVYERLQALEADREFLKHCIRSLKKGDKGMDLLQEILQHLRDLRNVELRVKNAGDALASLPT